MHGRGINIKGNEFSVLIRESWCESLGAMYASEDEPSVETTGLHWTTKAEQVETQFFG